MSKLEHRSSDASFCFYRYVIDPALRFLRNWISPSSGKPMRTCRTQASEWQTSVLQATDSAGTFKNRTWQDDPQSDNNVWSLTRTFLGSPFGWAPSGELGESWPAVWSTQPVESNLTAWFSRLPLHPKNLKRFTSIYISLKILSNWGEGWKYCHCDFPHTNHLILCLDLWNHKSCSKPPTRLYFRLLTID